MALLEEDLNIPENLKSNITFYWQAFSEQYPEYAQSLSIPDRQKLTKAWVASEFIAKQCLQFKERASELLALTPGTERPVSFYLELLETLLEKDLNEGAFMRVLRHARCRHLCHILWADVILKEPLESILSALSHMAEAYIQCVLDTLYQQHCARFGVPRDRYQRPQRLLILALGKLGGRELNVSSDVDLMFVYPENGELPSGKTHEQFFTHLVQTFIRVMDTVTVDGFVYRIDLRLRPYGVSGPLVSNLLTVGVYYQQQGRGWERFALVKARILNPQHPHAEKLQNILSAFVYRRSVDHVIIESLRSLKKMIEKETRLKPHLCDLKRGRGGIREIEFMVQATQILYGGKDKRLQTQSLLRAMDTLLKTSFLEKETCQALLENYRFLRTVENRIQGFSDCQTHFLPVDKIEQSRLMDSFGENNWQDFRKKLDGMRQKTQSHFNQMFSVDARSHRVSVKDRLLHQCQKIWSCDVLTPSLLSEVGFEASEKIARRLSYFKKGKILRKLTGKGLRYLNELIPLMMAMVSQVPSPESVLDSLLLIIESILTRSHYLALLLENQFVLARLMRLCQISHWVGEHIAKFPALLDELIQTGEALVEPKMFEKTLSHSLSVLPETTFDAQMEALKTSYQMQRFRIAMAHLTQRKPEHWIQEALTQLADAVVNHVHRLCWSILQAKHGAPLSNVFEESGFLVVAYGKQGSQEMHYQSDLDLIFLHACEDEQQLTKGAHPVTAGQFYARLAQRIIHALSLRTQAGVLYPVDSRLRPDGTSGLLVAPMQGFLKYQMKKAWTWEHQALLRARAVSGRACFKQAFEKLRFEVLQQKQSHHTLCQSIAQMREMVLSSQQTRLDTDGPGGLMDLEFLLQYLVLKDASPEILKERHHGAWIHSLALKEVFSKEDAGFLKETHQVYTRRMLETTLREHAAEKHAEPLMIYRQGVLSMLSRFNLLRVKPS